MVECRSPDTTTPVCCYCDAPLSCASCGREQPADAPRSSAGNVEAFDRYAQHDEGCEAETWHGKGPMRCSCGFYEARDSFTNVAQPSPDQRIDDAKRITRAVLDAIGRGGDNLAIYESVLASLVPSTHEAAKQALADQAQELDMGYSVASTNGDTP